MQRSLVLISIAFFIVGAVFLAMYDSYVHAVLFLVAGVLGIALYHAHFGFTSSFRHLIVSGRGIGIRAQMVMFAIANLICLPVLLQPTLFGHPVQASVHPVGVSVLVGSILFGIGMQLGDGCASGTLYHIGGGDARGLLTLLGFVAGSLLGTINFTWWQSTPQLGNVYLLKSFGPVGGLVVNLLMMAVVFVLVSLLEKRRNGSVEPLFVRGRVTWQSLVRGPWSWLAGALVLALGNFVILLLSGKAWGVTSAFALWGAKVAMWFGVPVQTWGYWQNPDNLHALNTGVLHHLETTDDIAIMAGALLAAALGGLLPKLRFNTLPWRMVVGLLFGGILMGYGARIAFGCNIGAYFSGIATFSLHGWEWFLGALIGSGIGVALRPVCRLANR
ncbi:MAG: YeeE/YedE family protein [Alicyclobacillus herbarius]|nr:YeeE/YedE family protein [Alicyclobacillus herbarius]